MSRTISRSMTAFVSLVVGLVVITTGVSGQLFLGGSPPQGPWAAQPATKNGEWPHYAGDTRGTRYSPLDQITASNFNKLEVAWRFKTDNLGPRPEYKLEGTPIMIKGVLYTTAGVRRSVVALNAKTGQMISSFGKDGVVDMKEGMSYGNRQQIDLESGEVGIHSTPAI